MMESPLHRAVAIVSAACLTAVPFAFASNPPPAETTVAMRPGVLAVPTLVVPDVRNQAYVFAEGVLEDAGFAWRSTGAKGFASNIVVAQVPKPGTRVVDTGAPLVTLKLAHNRTYPQSGTPNSRSLFRGTAVQSAS